MAQNQNRKRTLKDILLTSGVGAGMLSNTLETTEWFYEKVEEIAPRVQEYVGTVGSGVVEYGLPALAFLGCCYLTGLAVYSTDRYLKEQ